MEQSQLVEAGSEVRTDNLGRSGVPVLTHRLPPTPGNPKGRVEGLDELEQQQELLLPVHVLSVQV